MRPFTDKQIELVTTFADQAVIAIENVRLFDEIQDKSRQLEEASQHKSQFLANMSHELRTPLNAILGYTELMADGVYGEPPEKMRGVLKRIERNGKHLLGLINDVLDLSKIEAGQLVLELADYSIQGRCRRPSAARSSRWRPRRSSRFKVEVATQSAARPRRRARLTQVLLNLVGNAIKFTDAGEVAIKAAAANGSSLLRCATPVLASPQPIRPSFSRSSSRSTIHHTQEGRHRPRARHIQAHRRDARRPHLGRVRSPGQGSTFSFTLPDHGRAGGEASMSKRILVVEDQEDNRQILRDLLASADYEMTEAENGEEALAAVAKQRPDLILMDIQLPIMDGYEATRRIKADPGFELDPDHRRHLLCPERRRRQSREAGCDDYVHQALQPASTAGENSSIPVLRAVQTRNYPDVAFWPRLCEKLCAVKMHHEFRGMWSHGERKNAKIRAPHGVTTKSEFSFHTAWALRVAPCLAQKSVAIGGGADIG